MRRPQRRLKEQVCTQVQQAVLFDIGRAATGMGLRIAHATSAAAAKIAGCNGRH
jgi:hypothetical protein